MHSKAPMVSLTPVTPVTLHPWPTQTLASCVVTLPGALSVTVTRSAVLGQDGVTIEPGLAPLTVVSSCVKETQLADTSDVVTGIVVSHINVAIALTWLTVSTGGLRLTKISRTTSLTSVSDIVWLADTILVLSIL